MERREFLKGLVAALAIIAAPPSLAAIAKAVKPQFVFDPLQQYGNYVLTDGDPMLAAEIVLADARRYLPIGTPFEVMVHEADASDPLMRYASIGWKYSPKNRKGQYFA